MGSTALWIALLGASLATVLLAAAGLILVRQLGPRPPVRRPATARRGRAAEEDEGADLERIREEARRARQLAALAGTLELDELLAQILEVAAAGCRADAAAISLVEGDGAPLVKAVNLSPDETPPRSTPSATRGVRGR